MNPLVIDIHAHVFPASLYQRFAARANEFPGVQLVPVAGAAGAFCLRFMDAPATRPIIHPLSDLDARRRHMDKTRVDHQILSLWTDAEGYELPAAQGLAWSRFVNECIRDELVMEPRFTPLASVPLQDGKMAAKVMIEAMDQGFAGVMIGTLPGGSAGANLDDASLDPFWQAASDANIAVYLHPMFLCGEPRLNDYDLVNAVGRIADSSIAIARLLFSGHLLKFPGLKLVMSHGGAALPYALGRFARNHELAQGRYADPRKGFAALYFDSCVFDPEALEFLVGRASAQRVMLGSDAPMTMGDPDPIAVVRNARLSEAQRNAILGDTAQGVFRIRADCACGAPHTRFTQ